jgi:hypothetical protein
MYLMIKPSKDITWISKKSLADLIHSIYINVYDHRKTDLLDKTIANLPDVIDSNELKIQIP